ncbi:MAG: alpha-mannosidase [bacterium]
MSEINKKTKQIKVISNTHWDREFRKSFEKTRHSLMRMLDTTLDILENDPEYHSFTMDGHSIMIDDYLEMRPEREEQIKKFVQEGRLIIGPYYTLAEEFSISHEALVRNLLYGKKTVEKYGGETGTVAYTPSSWGQTGQLPQILKNFAIDKMMFYRGISHHESDAEFIWQAPDGTEVLASRFALYARYNWYYQVHRPVTRKQEFEKDYIWGEYDEVPVRPADNSLEKGESFELKSPVTNYYKENLKEAIEKMVAREGSHFTTEVFLAMNGHDISVAYPLESKIIKDAQEILGDEYRIEHTDLEGFWEEVEKHLEREKMAVLEGERRAHLKEGMWTFLFPATISARTYLKQQDFKAYNNIVYNAEPLAVLANRSGSNYPLAYLDRGWRTLLSNHTHDANGGCAPDDVCQDMETRYRRVNDIGDIVSNDSMSYIVKNLSPEGMDKDAMQLVVFNPLPFARDMVSNIELEIPADYDADFVKLESDKDMDIEYQPILSEKSSVFVDSIWDVPTIMESKRIKFYANLKNIPAMGYRSYRILPVKDEPRPVDTMIAGTDKMENEYIKVKVNENGTVDILNKESGKYYSNLNYFSDQGEGGNAWQHQDLQFDKKYTSLGVRANIAVLESGPLSSTISAEFDFPVPIDSPDGQKRNDIMVDLPIKVLYTLEKGAKNLKVKVEIDNRAKDHWLRANISTAIDTDVTIADSHFDIVERPIQLPDSTGWVEEVRGTHPLRTFVAVSDDENGIGYMTKGIYEYEAFDDQETTLALTLIRACRIKLAVSEEKQTELDDKGIQCPGLQEFEYSIFVFEDNWQQAELLNKAAEYYVPVKSVMSGRGKGTLALEDSFFEIDNRNIHVSTVKKSEDNNSFIIRLFNPLEKDIDIKLKFAEDISKAFLTNMQEDEIEELPVNGKVLKYNISSRKILTFSVYMDI